VVEVPVIWEVVSGGELVAFSAGAIFFFGLIGACLILQDLGDEPVAGFGGDEDGWHLQQSQGFLSSNCLLAFVLLDVPGLGSGRGSPWWLWWRVSAVVVASFRGWWWWCWWEWLCSCDGGWDKGQFVVRAWWSRCLGDVVGAFKDVVGPWAISSLLEPSRDGSVVFEGII